MLSFSSHYVMSELPVEHGLHSFLDVEVLENQLYTEHIYFSVSEFGIAILNANSIANSPCYLNL